MRSIYRLVSLAFVSCLLAASCATVVPYSPTAYLKQRTGAASRRGYWLHDPKIVAFARP